MNITFCIKRPCTLNRPTWFIYLVLPILLTIKYIHDINWIWIHIYYFGTHSLTCFIAVIRYDKREEEVNFYCAPLSLSNATRRPWLCKGFWESEARVLSDRPFWSNESRTAVHASKEILSQNNVLKQRNQTWGMYTDVFNVYFWPTAVIIGKSAREKCILMRGLMT